MRRHVRGLVFLGFLFAAAITFIVIPRIEINAFGGAFERGKEGNPLGLTLGLDLEGGTHLVYRGTHEDGSEPGADELEVARGIVEQRVNQFGLSEPTVQLLGNPPDRILVQLPGLAGARITVVFEGNAVSADELEAFFRNELGHPEAEVTVANEEAENPQLIVNLDELEPERVDGSGNVIREPEADRIRDRLEGRFPATASIIYPVEDTSATSTDASATSTAAFGEPTIEGIREAIRNLGLEGATAEQRSERIFRVTIPDYQETTTDEEGNVIPGDGDRLRPALNERFGPAESFTVVGQIEAYNVGGGIQEAKQLIGQTAQLEFRERECGPLVPSDEDTPWPPDGLSEEEWLRERCTNPKYYAESDIGLTGGDVVDAFAGTQPGIPRPVVNIEFDSDGAEEFFEVTDRIARTGGQLAIYLDGRELIAPTAQQGIAGGRAFIQGPDFTPERARTISIQLRSGALPVQLELVQERNVDATLGSDTIRDSVLAGSVGLGMVLIFMILYYKAPGLVASLALILYAALLLAVFKMVPVTLTLSGVAAVILSIGTAVDANILIAERTKEELRAGRTLLAAIREGFSRAWPSIRDANVSTIIVAVVLFWFGDRLGTSIIQGFALTFVVGVVVSMFTAFFASRIIARILAATVLGRRLSTWVPTGSAGAERVAEAGD